MTRPAQSEAALHAAVAQFLDLALPDDAVWHHSPNEGKRGWKAQAAIKRQGVRKGWPDIEVIYRGRVYFLELKSSSGRVAPGQLVMLDKLGRAGAPAMVCRSVDQVETFLRAYIPLKARAA